jgi:hypothetical protein
MRVRVGVEWINKFPLRVSANPEEDVSECQQPELHYSDDLAWGFYDAMGRQGHEQVFAWGDDNAWANDFLHNDFGGDALNWSDNVHFCYFASHAGQFPNEPEFVNKLFIGFASQHRYCLSSSEHWKLGSGMLKWMVFDCCDFVLNADANHIAAVWGPPMHGVHLIFGFIGIQSVGAAVAGRGFAFGNAVSAGQPLGSAWLDAGYLWQPDDRTNRPIVIAAGVNREDALNRRDNETLDFRDIGIPATNWLAWKWRS